MNRRHLLVAGAVLLSSVALARPPGLKHVKRMVRRKVRRTVRRRWRRRVLWRAVGPRRALVVPVAMAIGWELAVAADKGPDEIVIVKEVKSPTIIIVQGADGKTREMDYVKEDNADNSKDLDGSELAENDSSVHRATEVEEEKEVEE